MQRRRWLPNPAVPSRCPFVGTLLFLRFVKGHERLATNGWSLRSSVYGLPFRQARRPLRSQHGQSDPSAAQAAG